MTLDTRRDQYGRYLVVPPEGGKPVGYTRATTVAKTLEDTSGLLPWKAALALTGVMRRSGLRGRLEALVSQYPEVGPWYGSRESKAAVKKLVAEAAEAGGASDRADVGTALHALIEQVNRGEQVTVSQESTRRDVEAYQRTIATAGISFAEVEATVVLDGPRVAGMCDGIASVPALGGLVIADLKSGTDLTYGWQSIAVQLAIYANADALYRQGAATDGSEDCRDSMPAVSRDHALVIHLPAGEGRCDLYRVDIAAGWDAFERSMWARSWRTRRDLAQLLKETAA